MKVKQVYVSSREPEKLAEFYRKALGLPIQFADPGKWVQFKTEGAAFCIAGASETAVPAGDNAVVVLEVDDLEQALRHVREAAAPRVSAIRDMGAHGRVAIVEDTEGNVIQLYQRTTKPPA
jgi:predicted enzyme related to lactoylglutathione lyase